MCFFLPFLTKFGMFYHRLYSLKLNTGQLVETHLFRLSVAELVSMNVIHSEVINSASLTVQGQ